MKTRIKTTRHENKKRQGGGRPVAVAQPLQDDVPGPPGDAAAAGHRAGGPGGPGRGGQGAAGRAYPLF